MSNPIDALPQPLQDQIRRILERQVVGGGARFQRDGDRSGSMGQKAISQLLQDAGISKSNPLWQAVIDHGRELYHGKPGRSPTSKTAAPAAMTSAASEGPVYTSGSSFRARAEAHQRRFRAEVLNLGCGKWGHKLDSDATQAGANFHHDAALAAAETRAAAGKGVDRERTFGNMLSSQALCFNIMGPLAASPEGLRLAGDLLQPFVPGLLRVRSMEIEFTPPRDVFGDQSGLSGVDCDVLVQFDEVSGESGVLVIETKFVEPEFSVCGHRAKNREQTCPDDVSLGSDFAGCRYVYRNRFKYWQRTAETRSLNLRPEETSGCPFGGPLWQIWVNHTLAHALAGRLGVKRVVFAVCAPVENDTLLRGGAVLDEFRRLAADPASVIFIPLERLLERLDTLCAGRDAWKSWAQLLRQRYAVPAVPAVRALGRVTAGHNRVVAFMNTPAFRETVAAHRIACGARATVYFRPTDKGLVRIALHPAAPGYVGFRADETDKGVTLAAGASTPTHQEIVDRLDAFEAWLPRMGRSSDEERGVIPWLRAALDDDLRLEELGPGWVFLHQEWRFVDDDERAKKVDILAVHVASGQLGIVEFKSNEALLNQAQLQVREYGRLWQRDARELAPLFTALLRANGAAYGRADAACGHVTTSAAALFVGVAAPGRRISVRPV